jgi:protein phosphatase
MSLRWWSSCRTDGGRVREVNEDAYLEMYDLGLWLVADGMGGHTRGEVASQLIVDTLRGFPAPQSLEQFSQLVRTRLTLANGRVLELASRLGASRMMGSTVVALLVYKGKCACLWAGDSRAYLLRDGHLSQVTRDHSLAEQLVQRGELSREQVAHHPTASRITRAIGTQARLRLDERRFRLQDGDAILLCSDGLNKELSDQEIEGVLDGYDCDEASQELLDLSLERGARDNVTVAVIRFEATTGFGDTAMDNTLLDHRTKPPQMGTGRDGHPSTGWTP